ncbi:DUF397 domain-containing protein [Streptomyces sp. NBC_00631]|uniref:DUF397 domain-containing protein n=1 Tax=Streptomyces sp. NBC_00631 TaxID=2975793 RepID=UPI00386FEEBB
MAEADNHVAIRGSTAPARATLTFRAGAFAVFVAEIKSAGSPGHWAPHPAAR